jgi:hypothetical protein
VWPDDEEHAAVTLDAAIKQARALVRSEWRLIDQIAAVLTDCGYIDMDHPLLTARAA